MSKITELLALIKKLPAGLKSDWKGTNHYELLSGVGPEYWWLELNDYFGKETGDWCQTEHGKRLGLLMDISAAAKAAEAELVDSESDICDEETPDGQPESVTGYMDKIDFEEELGRHADGVRVFTRPEDIKKSQPCVEQCGIVEVVVGLSRVIIETDFGRGDDDGD